MKKLKIVIDDLFTTLRLLRSYLRDPHSGK